MDRTFIYMKKPTSKYVTPLFAHKVESEWKYGLINGYIKKYLLILNLQGDMLHMVYSRA